MSKIAFTPGPWSYEIDSWTGVEQSEIYTLTVNDSKGFAIAMVDGAERETESDYIDDRNAEFTANARLIAASPDMYEALKRALNFIENTEDEMGITLDSGDVVRTALARAEGVA